MSVEFRTYLQKIGSGQHTSKSLSRSEAERALIMILEQIATPAQIGAFLIAHRIKRPTAIEMTGFMDAYDRLGAKVPAIDQVSEPILVLGCPYDGRDRTMPISPLASLVVAAAGGRVLSHGGGVMPTKYGLPLIAGWQALGVDWQGLTLVQIQTLLQTTGLGFVYQPQHFPLAEALVPYRDQIGKRPPLATLELIWVPYQGNYHLCTGFVHPPTEQVIAEALALHGILSFTTVKGLEGSCDLPRDRAVVIGLGGQRLILHGRDFGLGGSDPELVEAELAEQMQQVLIGATTELQKSVIWNSGFYLWRLGKVADVTEGLLMATKLLSQGKVWKKLSQLQEAIAELRSSGTALLAGG